MKSTAQYLASNVDSSPRDKNKNIYNSRMGSANSTDRKTCYFAPLSARSNSKNIMSSSKHSHRSSSPGGKRAVLFYNKMLKSEAMYCIFTTRETSKYVLACDQPYSGKLLNESISTINDISCLQANPIQFKFDSVYDETSNGRQEKIYIQNVRPMVHSFIEGMNQCVALFGPS
jgi:hypothetical protein